jgi:hypothetical protein
MMARLAVRCRAMRAQVLEHVYQYGAFGSWLLYFDFRGGLYRVVLDARESELTLERASDPGRREFKVVALQQPVGPDAESVVNSMLDDLAAGAGD